MKKDDKEKHHWFNTPCVTQTLHLQLPFWVVPGASSPSSDDEPPTDGPSQDNNWDTTEAAILHDAVSKRCHRMGESVPG